MAAGSRESLAGRFERLTLNHWSASSLAAIFRIPIHEVVLDVVRFGSYPGAVALQKDPTRWRAYIRDAIIEPAIGRDVLALGAVRRPALLRQVFAVAVGSPAQIVSLQKLQGQLQYKGAIETVAHYLALLEDAYLVAGLERFSIRAHWRRAAPPKLVTLNNALLSAMHPSGPPDPRPRAGAIRLLGGERLLGVRGEPRSGVTYWREETWEVDAVLEGTWGDWALEVKTSRFDSQNLKGLLEFCRRHPRFRPLVITAPGDESIAHRHGLLAVNWKEFLVSGPPSVPGEHGPAAADPRNVAEPLIFQGLDDLAVVESPVQSRAGARGSDRGGQLAQRVVEELRRSRRGVDIPAPQLHTQAEAAATLAGQKRSVRRLPVPSLGNIAPSRALLRAVGNQRRGIGIDGSAVEEAQPAEQFRPHPVVGPLQALQGLRIET